jgi:long-subunit fatty acid transport protein
MYGFHSFDFTEHENHSGTGYNLKVGAIYKPTNYIRLGAAIHSPTFYNLEYTWYNEMYSQLDGNNYSFEGERYTFNYNLISPFKIETGAALQIKNIGLISMDYERVDYSATKLESPGAVMSEYGPQEVRSDNDSINNTLGAANNFRFGGEIKLNSFYIRGGYAIYQSPYNSRYNYRESDTHIYSGGVGYRAGSFFIDATFMTTMYTREKYLYNSIYKIFDETTEIDRSRNKIILSFGLRF